MTTGSTIVMVGSLAVMVLATTVSAVPPVPSAGAPPSVKLAFDVVVKLVFRWLVSVLSAMTRTRTTKLSLLRLFTLAAS